MAEDLSDKDVFGHVFWFKAFAADGCVGAAQVAWFPGLIDRTEIGQNVLNELRAGSGVNRIEGREGLEGTEIG